MNNGPYEGTMPLITAGGAVINPGVKARRIRDIFKCGGSAGEWVLSNDDASPSVVDKRACLQVCTDAGFSTNAIAPDGFSCASGERRPPTGSQPTPGAVITDAVYKSRFGCIGGGSNGGSICYGLQGSYGTGAAQWFRYKKGGSYSQTYPPGGASDLDSVYCYSPTQKKDGDRTDRRIACYCK